ncbi:MAG: GIY-YIG nuclease family protein [Hellea sp.]|nr:GIY-YIG nuclease family protein [Hellea sp.]
MFFTYMITSQHNGTLYIGHTDDLGRRIFEHKHKIFKGFATKHGVDKLVWFEEFETRDAAFRRERQLKTWKRQWKIRLIEIENPDWVDIYELNVLPVNRDWGSV